MKMFLFVMSAFLSTVSSVKADEVVVNDITIPQGGEATLNIELNNTTALTRFSLDLVLPDGVIVTGQTLGERFATSDHTVRLGTWPKWYRFIGDTEESMVIPGNSGTLIAVTLKADETLSVGSTYQGILTGYNQDNDEEIGMEFTTPTDDPIMLSGVKFIIAIDEPADTRTILDENSTTVPAAATNVDVRVKRTIKAGEWSTICLPFAMSEAQVKEAFGEDVDLADFDGTDPEFDGDDCVGIRANFTSVNAIEANHPYIIKVSQPISEFTLDDVDIVADEDEAYIEFDNGKTGSRRVVYSGFYGTYHAGTALDEFTLFLSDNKFWYSKGQTKMKAFRAYFEFLDVLTDVKNSSNVKLWVRPDVEDGLPNLRVEEDLSSPAYNLAGQRVGKSYKGVVIENGRKIVK